MRAAAAAASTCHGDEAENKSNNAKVGAQEKIAAELSSSPFTLK